MRMFRRTPVDPAAAEALAVARREAAAAEVEKARQLAQMHREQREADGEHARRLATQAEEDRQRRKERRRAERCENASGTNGFYLVAVVATAVSVNTSWRFFAQVLHIDNTAERAGMFAVLELALLACGIAMRAAVRRPGGKPGPARVLAWVLCGMAAYMALVLSGPVEGLARVGLGPALALVSLHLALGIEVRAHTGTHTGKAAQVWHELRERLLSRLGLADDDRDALSRTKDRAAERAARLATTGRGTPFRRRRLARAVRVSSAAIDPDRRERMLALIAAAQHLDDLTATAWPSPWQTVEQATPDHPATTGEPLVEPVREPLRSAQPSRVRARSLTAAQRVTAAHEAEPNATHERIAKLANTSLATVKRHRPKRPMSSSPSDHNAAQTPVREINGAAVALTGLSR